MTRIIWIVILSVFALVGCDKIEAPYRIGPQDNTGGGGGGGDTIVKVRKVLLEDFTGHTCGNCPRAGKKADEIKEIHGDKVIIMAVHAGSFANPEPPKYPNDFRTDVGNEIDQFFGISAVGNPNGMVNRIGRPNNTHIRDFNNWAGLVATEIAKPLDAFITIENTYNPTNKQVSSEIKTEFIRSLTGNYRLAAYLVEDNIISDQKDYLLSPTHNPNYLHRHVLRETMVGNAWGEIIANNPPASTQPVSRTVSVTLKDGWNPDNCYVVAFVYDATTYEVIQAEEKKIK
jgi:hypothetical protein